MICGLWDVNALVKADHEIRQNQKKIACKPVMRLAYSGKDFDRHVCDCISVGFCEIHSEHQSLFKYLF